MVDKVWLGKRRDHDERKPRAEAAASLSLRQAVCAGKGDKAGTTGAGAGESVLRADRAVDDRPDLMVIPAVGVVVCNDNRRAFPVGLLLEEVDDVDDEVLLVDRIGVAGMAVLISRRL